MVNMTLSIPDDVHVRMRRYPEIKWSTIARQALIGYLERLERMDELTKDSALSEKDVMEMDAVIKKAIMGRVKGRKRS